MHSHASGSSVRPAHDLRASHSDPSSTGNAREQRESPSLPPPPLSGFQVLENPAAVVNLGSITAEEGAFLAGTEHLHRQQDSSGPVRKKDASLADQVDRYERNDDSEASEQASRADRDMSTTETAAGKPDARHSEAEASDPDCEPVWEREWERRQQHHSPRQQRREKFEHEQDHDSCTFMTIRKSEWFVKFLDHIHRTSPMDPDKILASFSVKNDFMFYPPPKTYRFLFDDSGNVSVGESKPMADSDDDEARLRREQQHLATRKPAKRRHHVDYEAPPELDPRRRVGATHGISSGLGTYMTPSDKLNKFEMVFIPWKSTIQSYRIEKDEVILEKVITIGGPLFSFSLGCPIPCSIIRPNCRMSSHIAIFFHCNGEDIGHSSCMRLQTLANALHVTVLVPEYPGYGLFRGQPSEASVKGAMERVVQFLLSVDGSLTPSRLLLIGHSIGGAVAVHIASYIQKVFERMQAHYESDVACPGAYSNELAYQGKRTFFESYRMPSPPRATGDGAVHGAQHGGGGAGQPAARQHEATTAPFNVSFADDDADDDEVLARRGEAEQRQVVWAAASEQKSRTLPTPTTTTTTTPPPPYSPDTNGLGRTNHINHDDTNRINTSTSNNEPFGADSDDEAKQDPGAAAAAAAADAVNRADSNQWEHVVPDREDGATPNRGQRGPSGRTSSRSHRTRDGRNGGEHGGTDAYSSSSSSTITSDDEEDCNDADEADQQKTRTSCFPCCRHHGDSGSDSGEDEHWQRIGCCSFGGCIGGRKKVKRSTVTHCRHNALGGIILLSSFTALRCLEYVPTFKRTYKLHTTQLEMRRRQVPCDTVFPAPVDWREDASTRVPPEKMHFAYDKMTTPLIFKMSRFLSFNRFPTVDVMCELQEKYHYFNHTPLLLIHGTDDELISPIHSVAMATKVRQCRNGGPTARVFMSFLSGGGHNDLPCIREIRRFYKDQILKPHLQREQHFKKKLKELYNSGRNQLAAPLRDGTPLPVSARGGDSRAANPPPPPTELYFLSHGPAMSAHFEENRANAEGLTLPTGAGQERQPSDTTGSPRQRHHHHCRPHYRHGDGGVEGDNLTSGLVTREVSNDASQLFGATYPVATRSRNNSMAAAGRDKDICGPFIHREPSTLAEDDNPASAVLNASLLHTLEQTLSARDNPDEAAFAPAATMLHMSMFPTLEKYDVGSVLVAAVRANTLTKEAANALYMRHYHLAWVWRIAVASLALLASMVVLAIGITHAVLCQRSRIVHVVPPGHDPAEYARDNRVLAWSVLEATFLAVVSFLHLLSPTFGISSVSKERERHSHTCFKVFAAVNLIATALAVGFGIIMGFILAFTPHERGGVHWAKWSSLPYGSKVWISFVPRWIMVANACWHCLVFLFFVVKNH